jgi:hypothetical protein
MNLILLSMQQNRVALAASIIHRVVVSYARKLVTA